MFYHEVTEGHEGFLTERAESAATAEVNLLREITINGFSMENSG